jgi:hypothetical protein
MSTSEHSGGPFGSCVRSAASPRRSLASEGGFTGTTSEASSGGTQPHHSGSCAPLSCPRRSAHRAGRRLRTSARSAAQPPGPVRMIDAGHSGWPAPGGATGESPWMTPSGIFDGPPRWPGLRPAPGAVKAQHCRYFMVEEGGVRPLRAPDTPFLDLPSEREGHECMQGIGLEPDPRSGAQRGREKTGDGKRGDVALLR